MVLADEPLGGDDREGGEGGAKAMTGNIKAPCRIQSRRYQRDKLFPDGLHAAFKTAMDAVGSLKEGEVRHPIGDAYRIGSAEGDDRRNVSASNVPLRAGDWQETRQPPQQPVGV